MYRIIGLLVLVSVTMAFTKHSVNSPWGETVGINFQHSSLKEAKAAAKKTNKIIFIDAYTSWCGPCKKMAATSFKNKAVGDMYNEKFICLKVDMDKDVDGLEIAKMYKVRSYPTLLFISADGKLVRSAVGFQTADRLLVYGRMLP